MGIFVIPVSHTLAWHSLGTRGPKSGGLVYTTSDNMGSADPEWKLRIGSAKVVRVYPVPDRGRAESEPGRNTQKPYVPGGACEEAVDEFCIMFIEDFHAHGILLGPLFK